jgi:ketosteroid isomerase-like protein
MGLISDSYVEIMNLVYSYPDRIDNGDFAGVGALFADAVIEMGDGETLVGSAAVQAYFEQWTRRYPDDGTPHTRHCITNPIVEIDEDANTASVRSYITVFQRTDDFALQPVWANKYEDRFERIEGRWRFSRRRGYGHLPGDVSHHLLLVPGDLT